MRKLIFAAILTLGAALALPAGAQTQQVIAGKAPGVAGVARTIDVEATITHVDAKTREVTLKGPQGNEITVVAGPEVKNFAQLEAGQTVTLQYLESLVLELKKGGGAPVARSERGGSATAKPGETPGAIGGRQVTVVGDVVGLDPATQTVTVRGPRRTVELDVRDPEQFKLIAIGDQIEATYTEAVAVSVTPTQKK
ncbi:MAG TPA: hypothetical protein VLU54_05775 [Casimicrobiaceae bacterium]|nr:hypothetical protein [Casimicrobiaceae bacterium]